MWTEEFILHRVPVITRGSEGTLGFRRSQGEGGGRCWPIRGALQSCEGSQLEISSAESLGWRVNPKRLRRGDVSQFRGDVLGIPSFLQPSPQKCKQKDEYLDGPSWAGKL